MREAAISLTDKLGSLYPIANEIAHSVLAHRRLPLDPLMGVLPGRSVWFVLVAFSIYNRKRKHKQKYLEVGNGYAPARWSRSAYKRSTVSTSLFHYAWRSASPGNCSMALIFVQWILLRIHKNRLGADKVCDTRNVLGLCDRCGRHLMWFIEILSCWIGFSWVTTYQSAPIACLIAAGLCVCLSL